MALPIIPLPTDEVEVGGEMVTVRGLSRSAALYLRKFTPETADEGEAFILSQGADVTLQEAKDWLASADVESAGKLIDRIVELSNLPKPPTE